MKISRTQTAKKSVHGVNLRVYNTKRKGLGFVTIDVRAGHFEEFYHKKSTFIYYVIKGSGTFYLNGKLRKVKVGDLIVIPPKTKIYYLGNMRMTLTTIPAWSASKEVHVRFIPH